MSQVVESETENSNPEYEEEDTLISNSDEDSTSSSDSSKSDDSKSSTVITRRRKSIRNGRKRWNAKVSKREFMRLQQEQDYRRKFNKLHPYPSDNSKLNAFYAIDIFDITYGIEPDQLDVVDWTLGAGRLCSLKVYPKSRSDTDNKENDIVTTDASDSERDSHKYNEQCPCCRALCTDTEDELIFDFNTIQIDKRNKIVHDIVIAPNYFEATKCEKVTDLSVKSNQEVVIPVTPPPPTNVQDVHAWKNETTKGEDRIAKSLVFEGYVSEDGIRESKKPASILYDTGSGTQIISPSYVEKLGITPVKMEKIVSMRFGNGTRGGTQLATIPLRINIQGVSFLEEFIVAFTDVPGVDIVLGLSFQNRVKSEIRYSGDNKMPYVLFQSGERIYSRDSMSNSMLAENTADVKYMAFDDAYKFLKKNMPSVSNRNKNDDDEGYDSWEDDTEVYLVSVSKQMELDGTVPPPPKKEVKVHPDIQKLLDKYDLMRTEVPVEDIRNRPHLQSSYHKLTLKKDSKPFRQRARPLSAEQMEVAQEIIRDAMHLGIMAEAPKGCLWGAPIMVIRKGGNRPGVKNQWRIVTDYRGLNKLTEDGTYAPPVIRDLLERLVGKKFFSKSDNVGGFYQLPLLPEDYEKTAFVVPTKTGQKTYMFTVASLGLQGCPSTYQQFMEEVLEGINDVTAYLDDIIYASNTWEEHLQTLDEAFARLAKNKVYLHPLKCEWGVTEIEYLGMKVSQNRISIADDKLAALKAYSPPTDFKGVRRFLGFCQYLAHFIPNYSSKVSSISDMLKGADKKKKFVWTSACQEAFESVLKDLASSQGLGIPNKDGQLVLETDASGLGVGACLYQFVNDRLVPLWYLSKKFSRAEQNYSTRDREALAVIYALRKLEQYLLGKPFILYSDHESLSKFATQPFLQGRDWRYQETVAQFQFEQRYRKGELMTVPDALSRAFDDKESLGVWHDLEHDDKGSIIVPKVGILNAKPGDTPTVDINVMSSEYAALQGIDLTEAIKEVLAMKAKKIRKQQKKYEREVQFYNIAARVFSDLHNTILQAYSSDSVMGELKTLAEKPIEELSAKQLNIIRKYSIVGGLLYYKVSEHEGDTPRLCIPHNEGNGLRLLLMFEAHDGLLHSGSDKTYARLASRYWWPTMQKDCLKYCESCRQCKLQASRQQRPLPTGHGHAIPEGRWDVIHADWITDLPETSSGHDAILVVHDRVTKYAYFLPAMKGDTAETTAKRLFSTVFSVHGLPRMVISDRDHLFTAKFFAELMRILDVKQHMGTSYQHDFNGAAEVLNKTVEVMLRHVVSDHPDRDFDDYLPLIQWAYNTSVHSSTGVSPYYAMWGFEPRHPLELKEDFIVENNAHGKTVQAFVEHQQNVLKQVRDALSVSQDTMEGYMNNTSRKDVIYAPGEMVYLSTKNLGKAHFKQSARKLRPRFAGPFKVLSRCSQYSYKLELPKKLSKLHPVFHVSLLWRDKPDVEMNAKRLKSNRDSVTPTVQEGNNGVDNSQHTEGTSNLVPLSNNLSSNDDGLTDVSESELTDNMVTEDGELLYLVEAIIDRKKVGKSYKYLVKWKNYPDSENTWQFATDPMGDAVKKMIVDYNAKLDSVKKLRGVKRKSIKQPTKVTFDIPSSVLTSESDTD